MNINQTHARHTPKFERGFTLVETLIAITILASAVAGTMTIAFQGLRGAQIARDQLTASNLAQEGMDLIRAQRDENYLSNQLDEVDDSEWIIGLDVPCAAPSGCTVDMTDPTANPTACPGTCPPLRFEASSGRYSQRTTPGWTITPFTRKIVMTSASPNQYYLVTVTVSWNTGPLAREFVIREPITNWQSKL